MHLPQTAEYALRAMTYIANLREGESVRARDLGRAIAVPGPYLSKLLRRMVVAKLLTSRKGHGGGFVLAQPPTFIRFLDILTASDYDINPKHCAFGWGSCNPHNPCPMHPTWTKLNDSLCTWAATTTLADVLLANGLPSPADVLAGRQPPAEAMLGRDGPLATTRRGRKPLARNQVAARAASAPDQP